MGIQPNFDSVDSPLLQDDASYATGGMVSNLEPHLLDPSQFVRLLNVDPTVAGRRQRRKGVTKFGSAGLGNPNGIFPFAAAQQGKLFMYGLWGSQLYVTLGDTVWFPYATATSLVDTLYMSQQGRGRNNLPTLYLSSCVAATDNVSLPYGKLFAGDDASGGITSVTLLDVRPRAISWFQSRLWGFNSGISGPDFLFWSSPLDGRDFSNGQTVQIGPDDGQEGTAIVPMRDGTPRLMLFKQSSIYQLEISWTTDGYYPTTANTLDFTKSQLRPIALNTGCVGSQALVWTPGQENADLLFLSREGIRSLRRSLTDAQGGAGKPLSYRIQPLIDRINWDQAHRTVAAFWDDSAYFALPVDGAVRPNLLLRYDVNRDAFYELDWQVASMTPCRFFSGTIPAAPRFFFMGSSSGTETGIGAASGATNGFHVYRTDDGQVDPYGLPVSYSEESRAFSFDVQDPRGSGLEYAKRWSHIDLQIQSAATHATLTIDFKVDDDDNWSNLTHLYINPKDAFPYLPIALPFSFSVGTMLQRSIYIGDIRHGKKIQFRIHDEDSFGRYKIISLQVNAFPENPRWGNA